MNFFHFLRRYIFISILTGAEKSSGEHTIRSRSAKPTSKKHPTSSVLVLKTPLLSGVKNPYSCVFKYPLYF
jgi:hypothetical protein